MEFDFILEVFSNKDDKSTDCKTTLALKYSDKFYFR